MDVRALGVSLGQQVVELAQDRIHQHTQLADRMIAGHTLVDGDVGEHAKLLGVRTTHQYKRSVIEVGYGRVAARRFLDSMLMGLLAGGYLGEVGAQRAYLALADGDTVGRPHLVDLGGPRGQCQRGLLQNHAGGMTDKAFASNVRTRPRGKLTSLAGSWTDTEWMTIGCAWHDCDAATNDHPEAGRIGTTNRCFAFISSCLQPD